jgi:DNA-cytosine methyltransferase
MNVLSLFDGMSCGRIALDRAGIQVNKYYASELDKYAIKVSQANYPDIEHLGDVTEWREWDIDWNIDLLIGGSPCQGFSFAGKQLAFDDPRSALFFVYVDILNHIKSINPNVKFMLENVRMKKEFLAIITEQVGVEPIFINSALVSAQNRQRYYWCNWDVEQPEDKGILLKDIIDDAQTEKDKSYCIDANYHKGATWEQYKTKSRRQQVLMYQKGRGNNPGGIRAKDGKTPCLSANSWENNNFITKSRRQQVLCGAMRGRYIVDGKRADTKVDSMVGKTEQRIEIRDDEKTNCLTTVQKDNLVMLEKSQYRKLTPIECERLQTVPDNYTNHVSNTQRYKMLGNGWTVDVIAHIFKELV